MVLPTQGSAYHLSFSADGKKLAAAVRHFPAVMLRPCVAPQVIVLDVATGEELCTIQGNYPSVTFRDVATGKELCKIQGIYPEVAFIPDGKTLALTGEGGISLHDALTGNRCRILGTNKNILATALAVSADGTLLASVEMGFTETPVQVMYYQIVIWNLATGQSLARFQAQTEQITSTSMMAFSPDGAMLVWGNGRSATVREIARNQQTYVSFEGDSPCLCVAFSPDGKKFATGHTNGKIVHWYPTELPVIAVIGGGHLPTTMQRR